MSFPRTNRNRNPGTAPSHVPSFSSPKPRTATIQPPSWSRQARPTTTPSDVSRSDLLATEATAGGQRRPGIRGPPSPKPKTAPTPPPSWSRQARPPITSSDGLAGGGFATVAERPPQPPTGAGIFNHRRGPAFSAIGDGALPAGQGSTVRVPTDIGGRPEPRGVVQSARGVVRVERPQAEILARMPGHDPADQLAPHSLALMSRADEHHRDVRSARNRGTGAVRRAVGLDERHADDLPFAPDGDHGRVGVGQLLPDPRDPRFIGRTVLGLPSLAPDLERLVDVRQLNWPSSSRPSWRWTSSRSSWPRPSSPASRPSTPRGRSWRHRPSAAARRAGRRPRRRTWSRSGSS
jgi:hypothetical protein